MLLAEKSLKALEDELAKNEIDDDPYYFEEGDLMEEFWGSEKTNVSYLPFQYSGAFCYYTSYSLIILFIV